MKKILLVLLLVPVFVLSQSNFYRGYSAGWKKGYCGETYGCIPPVMPTPPSPRSGFNSYEDGYARGLNDGSQRGSNSRSSLSAGQINYGNSGNSQYNKYKDANRYQSGGATEQQMVGDAVDKAIEENRLRRQRASQGNSFNNAPSIDYRFYNSGVKELKSGKFREGIRSLDIFIDKNPNDVNALLWRADGYISIMNYEKACLDIKRAADLGSDIGKKMLIQNCNSDGTKKTKIYSGTTSDKTFDFSDLETLPVYPGCESNPSKECFNRKINKHIKKLFYYPEINREMGCQAIIFATIIFDQNGNVKNIQTTGNGSPYIPPGTSERKKRKFYYGTCKGISGFEKVVVSIFERLPQVKPALVNNNRVNFKFTIPVTFRLQ